MEYGESLPITMRPKVTEKTLTDVKLAVIDDTLRKFIYKMNNVTPLAIELSVIDNVVTVVKLLDKIDANKLNLMKDSPKLREFVYNGMCYIVNETVDLMITKALPDSYVFWSISDLAKSLLRMVRRCLTDEKYIRYHLMQLADGELVKPKDWMYNK